MEKKNETEMYFDLIFKNLTYSENIAINLENQISILNIKEDDFFQINTKIKKTINELDDYIDEKINDIIDIELFHNSLDITQHSLTTRYYLENKEFGKLLEEIYEPLEEGTFFYLDLDNFKGLMIQHWIFDGNYFTNILNDAIYEANKEIKSELGVKFEEYKDTIENEINKFFRKDIVNIVRELFETNIKSLSLDQISNINNAIQENLKDIKDLVKNDLKRIDSDDKNYYNISQVNRTFIFYKEYIYEKNK
jgi:gas vesicle protein